MGQAVFPAWIFYQGNLSISLFSYCKGNQQNGVLVPLAGSPPNYGPPNSASNCSSLGGGLPGLLLSGALVAPANNKSENESILRTFQKDEHHTWRKYEIICLSRLKVNRFKSSIKEPAIKQQCTNNELAIQLAKDVKRLEVYEGINQKDLNLYLKQYKSAFWQKPFIYSTAMEKVNYAKQSLGKTF